MGLSEILWLIVLAAGLLLEGIGVLSGKDMWYTASDLIRKWVPKVLIAAFLVWAGHHFNVI
jgi:hypothetical protein